MSLSELYQMEEQLIVDLENAVSQGDAIVIGDLLGEVRYKIAIAESDITEDAYFTARGK